jgi:ADP-ribose pyrophosphatase YjhB (NUDIX family)
LTPANKIALWADALRDISAIGLLYSGNTYDEERYSQIQDIAMEMLAFATNESPAHLEPLRKPVFSRPSPLVGGDGAVIDDTGRLLLIQRADNGMWAMPGGLLEVGETPAEGVAREVFEETGVHCQAVALIAVFDSRLWGTTFPLHMYQFQFLCKPLNDKKTSASTTPLEVQNVDWFTEDVLPDNIDPGHILKIPEAFRVWKGDSTTFFDGQNQ